jgi:hypothetical protein
MSNLTVEEISITALVTYMFIVGFRNMVLQTVCFKSGSKRPFSGFGRSVGRVSLADSNELKILPIRPAVAEIKAFKLF